MKYIILISTLLAIAQADLIWKQNYTEFGTQFEKWQSTTDNPLPQIIEEDGNQVLYFDGDPTHYNGIVTKNIPASSTGRYFFSVEYKGEEGIRAGGYLGFVRSDQPNVQRTLGLDADINMEFSQIFRFNTNGDWDTYLAYIEVPAGVEVQLILEKGNYFGITKQDAKFRNILVYDLDLCAGECPATDEALKLKQLHYYTFVFFNNELQHKIFGNVVLDDNNSSKGTFTMKHPHNPLCCVKPSFYLLDRNGDVVEDFAPTYSTMSDLDFDASLINDVWEKSFTMNDVENWGCVESATTTKNGDATLYACDMQVHFYYDYAKTFANKQSEYDYSKNNSQGIFKSQFFIAVYKQTQTCFNSYITTLVKNAICTGICKLDLTLTLDLQYKLNQGDSYQPAQPTETTPVTLTWGDYVYFKIASDPKDYNLQLMKVVIETSTGTAPLGDFFIANFIKNKDNSTQGELTFEMLISGEAGLTKGKKFNLLFLTEAEAVSRRLLEQELPTASLSSSQSFQAGEPDDPEDNDTNSTTIAKEEEEENETEGSSAIKLSLSFLALLALAALF